MATFLFHPPLAFARDAFVLPLFRQNEDDEAEERERVGWKDECTIFDSVPFPARDDDDGDAATAIIETNVAFDSGRSRFQADLVYSVCPSLVSTWSSVG